MKVKALQRFNDKVTKELREVDKVYEYETERAKELISKGFVEKTSDDKNIDEPKKVAEIEQEEPKTAKKKHK